MNPLSNSTDTSSFLVRQAQIRSDQAAQTAKMEAASPNAPKIEASAKQFEAVFATEMLKPMFDGLGDGKGMFGGGQGEKVFSGMMIDQYGKQMAERDSLGLVGHIKNELLTLQEAKSHGN